MSEKNEAPAVTQMGSTFAERKAAYSKLQAKPAVKQVAADEDQVEDKAVTSSETKKRTTRKKS